MAEEMTVGIKMYFQVCATGACMFNPLPQEECRKQHVSTSTRQIRIWTKPFDKDEANASWNKGA